MPSGRRTWRRRPLSGPWSTNPTTRGGGCSSWRRTWRGTRRGARLGSGGTSRCSRPSRRRAGRLPMRRWRSRATGRASGLRSTSFRRATARCCYYGIRDYHTKRSPRRPDWRAARSARRSRGRAGGWCRFTKPESQVSMSHVDDGTLHTYLDGELAPAEARGVDAHLAQCPACRERLEQERALITRAGELLALAAPPDRELPPFRAGDVKPPTRLWWRVRLPLAWAATIVLALGIGTYLGRGVEQGRRAETAADTAPARLRALEAPISADTVWLESRAERRGTARTPPAAPAAPAPAARRETDGFAQERKAQVAVIRRDTALSAATPAPVPAPAPQAAFVMVDGALVEKASPISLDSARALLGADPLAVPGAPIRTMYRAREIGYSAVVIVEQALDSSTVIEVVNGRRSPLALDAVVVAGAAAPVAQADSVRERAPLGRARIADSLAAAPAAKAAARLERYETQNRGLRRLGDLEVRVSGPLPSDSLGKLLQLVQPVKP